MPRKKIANQEISGDAKAVITVLLLLFITPIGLLLMWFWTKWNDGWKCIITLIYLFLIVFVVFMANKTDNKISNYLGGDNFLENSCLENCKKQKLSDDCNNFCMNDFEYNNKLSN